MGGGEIMKKFKKTESNRIETAGDISVIVNPYLWKLFKNDDQNFTTQRRN